MSGRTPAHIALEACRVENRKLRDENAALRALLDEPGLPEGVIEFGPIDWNLTACEAFIITRLARLGRYDPRRDFGWPGPSGDAISKRSIDVIVLYLRRKIAPFGVTIVAVRGAGFIVDPMVRAGLAAALDGHCGAVIHPAGKAVAA